MRCWILVATALLVSLGAVDSGVSTAQSELATSAAPAPSAARVALARLPLYFVENRGVHPEAVRYSVVGADKTLFFTDRGVTMVLRRASAGWAVKLDFPGANPGARVAGRDRQGAVVSYFHGPARTWKTGVPTFAGLVYPDLWPGIDLLYRGTTDRLKYAFEVAPGADPSCIRLRYRGVDAVTRTADGALEVRTPAGSFRDETPVAGSRSTAGAYRSRRRTQWESTASSASRSATTTGGVRSCSTPRFWSTAASWAAWNVVARS